MTDGTGYLKPYQEMVRKVGPRFEALLWTREETQAARFNAIAELCDLTGRVVVDAGCGRADFAVWMRQAEIHYGAYIGVEAIPELADVARERAGDAGSVVAGDFVATPDLFRTIQPVPEVICFSGSLNTLTNEHVLAVLERAWDACTEALVFNFLSDQNHGAGAENLGPARRFDTLAMVRWAFERTPLVVVDQTYLRGNDATIAMRKARPA